MLYIFETLGEVKVRYFLPGSVLLFLLHKQNPDVTWERRKKREQKVKLLLFLQGSGLAQPPPLGPRGCGGVGSRAGQHPRGRAGSAKLFRVLGLTPPRVPWDRPPGCGDSKRSGVLRPQDSGQGWPEATAGRQLSARGRWGPPRGEAVPSCAGGRGAQTLQLFWGRALVRSISSRSTSRAVRGPSSGAKMPALHIEDLPEKEKLKLEVEQLRKEVKLQRQQVSELFQDISFSEINQGQLFLVCCSKTSGFCCCFCFVFATSLEVGLWWCLGTAS